MSITWHTLVRRSHGTHDENQPINIQRPVNEDRTGLYNHLVIIIVSTYQHNWYRYIIGTGTIHTYMSHDENQPINI